MYGIGSVGIGMLAGIYSMMNDDINVMQKIVFANPRLKVLVMEDVCTLRGRWGFVSNFFLLIDCHHFCIRRGKIVPDDLHAIPCGLRFRLRVGGGGLGIAWDSLLYAARAIYE